jgi:hypothetical protein
MVPSATSLIRPALLTLPVVALCSTSASAQTVIPVNLAIGPEDPSRFLYVSLANQTSWVGGSNAQSASDFYFYYLFSDVTKPQVSTNGKPGLYLFFDTNSNSLTDFNVGDVISTLAPTTHVGAKLVATPGTYYFGFSYSSDGETPSTFFGYGEYSIGEDASINVAQIAFDTNPITVVGSAIPEPSTYAAAAGLLAGSAALLRRRQQRKAALAAAA